ncbi:PQQ-binding-like beta-propeller repeat protein [Rivibacter subsaxonicus]|uniref:Polyvinyl alcohol dehydrogenase (Cytochrome) n=1 Tax=Rivibacter subsaxonicus TaxID=457575 RepID=A0A4Q7VMX0_9BURK|nr:PQQ-binding-like beta-propeller repeat protein [Rivibacter subsaxonicus]RZT97686.1 polyvinyl alcohol dehydrogenase (cytochrome) [Rivibacter subsaxonicus]
MRKQKLSIVALGAFMGLMACGSPVLAEPGWAAAGNDLKNSRFQADETRITAKTVGGLQLKWSLTTTGDVTANPAVEGQYLYFPDSAGFLYKVDRITGALVWKRPISDYTGIAGDFARATPAIAGNALILGNQSGKFLGTAFGQPNPQPARVFAVDKASGNPLWSTQVDTTALSFVTHSAIVANGTAFVGTASNEELVAAFVPPEYWQWQFRGSVVALDVATGAIKWQTYTVPAGYFGGAVWGSTGAVDIKSNQVFMATGNNYAVPKIVLECLGGGGTAAACMSADNHFDSIIAMDMTTGAVKWAGRGLPPDVWNVACGLNTPGFTVGPWFPGVYGNCPNGNPATAGPDYDFAQGPIWLGGGLVGAGQKSGMFWAFDHKTGALAWSTQVAPGGVTGGLQWGSATDGNRIFVAVANSGPSSAGGGVGALPWTLKDGSVTTAGGWAALDRKTGAVLWTTKDPMGSRSEAAVSAANDVVFGCNLALGAGTMYALNAKSGQVLWSYNSGAPCNAGPSIVDGMVYWGSGTFISPGGPQKVFAFGLN